MPSLDDTIPAAPTEQAPSTTEQSQDQASLGPDAPFSLTVRLPKNAGGSLLTLQTSARECVQDLRLAIAERPETFAYSCFYLRLGSKRLHDVEELGEIPGMSPDVTLDLVEDVYTEREVRIHLTRLRDLLCGPVRTDLQGPILDSGRSLFSTITAASASSSSSPTASVTKSASKKDGKSDPSSPSSHAFTHYDPQAVEVPRISRLHARPDRSTIPAPCLRSLAISGWSPPPRPQRLQGHLLYLTVTSLEGEVFQVTCCTRGFYINASSQQHFDPAPRKSNAKDSSSVKLHHSLINLLSKVSPLFASRYAQLQSLTVSGHHPLETLPISLPSASMPWAIPGATTTSSSPSSSSSSSEAPSTSILARHRHDACRPAERWLLNGIDSGDAASSAYGGPGGMRDWNEELQGHRELPKSTPAERLIRERLLHRLHVEFTAAAVRGAIAVVEGEVPALNPGAGEGEEGLDGARMFLHEGIFYSCGYDDRGAIAALGGPEAGRVATGKDVAGVRLLNNVDPEGLSTIGTVVVDYKGERVVAQTIVPGIFQKQEQAVIYGAIEGEEGEKETIVGDSSLHELLKPLAKSLHLREREVSGLQNKESKESTNIKLWTSVDVKGLQGTDGRKYILDMYRSTPLDLPWLKQVEEEKGQEGQDLPYPHSLALLRPELVDLYWETQLRRWASTKAEKIKIEVNEQFPLPDLEDNEETKEETKEEKGEEKEGEKKKSEKELESEKILQERRKALETRLSKEVRLEEFTLAFDPDVTLASLPSDYKDTSPEWKAGQFLRDTLIPSFISDLLSYRLAPVDGESLIRAMHRSGLNARYLGLITQKLQDAQVDHDSPLRLAWILRILRREMVLRSFKHLLRKAWKATTIEEIRGVTTTWLNQLFQGSELLLPQLSQGIQSRFRYLMTPEDLKVWLEDEMAEGRGGIPLLREVCRRMGIQILARDYLLTPAQAKGKAYLFPSDILNITPIFKTSTPRAAMADEAFEHGRLSLSQESSGSSSPEKEGQVGYELLMEAMALYEQTYGLLHPETAKCYASVATLLYHMGQQSAALEYQRKAVVAAERTCGVDHPDTINFYLNLGLFEQEVGDVPRSLRILRHAMDLWSYVHGPGHPDSITADSNVAVILQGLQDHSKALSLLTRAKDTQIRCLGPRELQTANCYHALARAHALKGEFKEAMTMEREAASIYEETAGHDDPKTKESEFWLQQLTTNAVLAARKAKEQATNVKVPAPNGKLGMMKPGKGASPGPKQPKARGELPIDELLRYIESPSRGKGKGKKASSPSSK